MNLPSSIQAYFDADKRNDGGAPIHAFTPDAVLKDEGQTHTGHQAIDAWWREVKAKYRAVAEPLEIDEKYGVARVRTRVTGQFPGSPLMRTFVFRLKDDQITGLDIGE